MKPIPTVAVLVIDRGKVLLVKHTEKAGHLTGIYGLPGGRLNKGENDKQAAFRELEEETGLIAESLQEFPGGLFVTDLERKDGVKRYRWRVFICKKFKGTIQKSEETIPEWVRIEDLKNYNLLANTESALKAGQIFLAK